MTGFAERHVVMDATNRLRGEQPSGQHASNAEFVAARVGSPVAKVFNLNFGALLEQAAQAVPPHQALWVGDEAARAVVEHLVRDTGLEPVHAGDLAQAGVQEAFATMLMGMVASLEEGLLAYRFATPARLSATEPGGRPRTSICTARSTPT